MAVINNPDIDPANNYSLVGVVNFAFQKMMQSMNSMLPAQVTAYDRENNRVSAQILINLSTTDGQQVPRPHLVNIPVLLLGGGKFSLSFPLASGDLGWILASDRDISTFLKSYTQTAPPTTRTNNFADSMFIPDLMKSQNIDSTNEANVILQSNDGTMTIEMGINTVNGRHEVNINADRININPNTIAEYVVINGNLAVGANITAVGTITPSTPLPP